MKRFYAIPALLLSCSLAASAFTPRPDADLRHTPALPKAPTAESILKKAPILNQEAAKKLGTPTKRTLKAAPAKTEEEFNVITNPPAGETWRMCGSSFTFYMDYGEVMQDEWDGLAYDAVVTPDGEFYLKNPVSTLQWDTYIKGQLTDEGITFDFPQPLYRFEDEEEGNIDLYADVLEYVEYDMGDDDYIVTFEPSQNTRSITFEKTEEGYYMMPEGLMLGVTYLDEWQGYGEFGLVLKPFEGSLTVVPDGVKFDDSYILADEILGWGETILRPMSIGINGTDAYLKGMSLAMPDAVIKGEYDETEKILSIPTDQFMGRFYNYYIFMMNGDGCFYYNEDWGEEMYDIYFSDEPIRLRFDEETHAFYPITEEEHFAVMIFNFGNTMESPCEYYAVDRIYSQGEITDYAPIAPEILELNDISERDPNYSYSIEFNIFGTNKEGQILQDNNIYYNVYLNGELYTLTAEDFPAMKEVLGIDSITDVPASLSDDDDIYAYGTYHGLAFMRKDIESIGIRALYIDGDIRAASDIVTVYTGSGVKATMESAPVSEEYFDLTGARINGDSRGGVIIRRSILSDGTVKSEKILRK